MLGGLIRYEDSQYRIQNSRLYIAFIANEDVTVNAKFHELGYYSFKAVSSDETMGTVEVTPECLAGGTQQEATRVIMRAIPKTGYRFKEWIEADGSTYLSAEQKMIPLAQFAFGTKEASLQLYSRRVQILSRCRFKQRPTPKVRQPLRSKRMERLLPRQRRAQLLLRPLQTWMSIMNSTTGKSQQLQRPQCRLFMRRTAETVALSLICRL